MQSLGTRSKEVGRGCLPLDSDRRVNAIARLTFLGIVLLCLGGCGPKAAQPPIRIGHLAFERSDADRPAAEHARRGIDLAVEHVNKKDLIRGRPVLVYHPAPSSDRKALQAQAVRLITINKVAALLADVATCRSADLPATADLYNVPLVTPSGWPGHPPSEYAFYTGLTPQVCGRILADFAADQRMGSATLLKPSGDPLADATAAAFAEELRKKGARSSNDLPAYKDAASLKEVVKTVAGAAAKTLFFAGSVDDLIEMAHSGLDEHVSILWGTVDGDPRQLQAARLANTVYMPTIVPPQGAGEQSEFARTYHERFGESPDIHVTVAFDDARILFAAMRQAEQIDGPNLQKALLGLKEFPVAAGKLSFLADHTASRPLFVLQLKKGQWETTSFKSPAD